MSAEALYEQHARLVHAVCLRLLRNRDDAADAAQQTFLSAHRALAAGTRPDDPVSWLAAIARNECLQRIRRQAATPTAVLLDDDLDGHGDTTHAAAVRAVAAAQLTEAVAALPERQRQALLLREVRGLSYDEVADSMGVTAPAVETLLWRARRTVMQRVKVVPDLATAWLRDIVGRLGGPLDVVSTGAVAAKGAATLVAALTATTAAVEVQRQSRPDTALAAPTRVDNSGPGSASSGRGRGRGRSGEGTAAASTERVESSGKGRGQGRGRGRGRSGEGETRARDEGREAEDRSGSGSSSGSDDRSGSGSGSDD